MKGRFLLARRLTAYGLIALFAALPYFQLNGRPLVLLDIPARRFTILGFTFLPTDTLLLALFVVGCFVAIFMLTALLGRVWCGWGCPQTVYMEFLYRPIERFFDGTPGRRRSRFQGSGPARLLKYATFVVVSCAVAHIFLSYFVGVERLSQWVRQSPLEHPVPFLVMLSVTGLMLFDFGFFREQTCIVACPYGRFQSVMLDRQSLIVSYDERRGEPRGALKRQAPSRTEPVSAERAEAIALPLTVEDASRRAGDCIDCGMCVVCCPTGIDIRRGLQMECIGCAQCIDACDAVMDRIKRPRGLIRYSSQAAMAGEPKRLLRPRLAIYPLMLAAVLTAFVVVLSRTGGFHLTVTRGMGATFTEMPGGLVANPLKVKIVNRTGTATTYTIAAKGLDGARVVSEENPVVIEAEMVRTVPIMIEIDRARFAGVRSLPVTVEVADGHGRVRRASFQLLGPGNVRSPEDRPPTTPRGAGSDLTPADTAAQPPAP